MNSYERTDFTPFVRSRTVEFSNHCADVVRGCAWLQIQDSPDRKLFASVLTDAFYGHTFPAHNKQGGCGWRILPD